MRTILLVEDDKLLRGLFHATLSADYRVLAASNGREAILIFQERCEEIDLLVTDHGLPHLSGRDLITRCRTLRPTIRCVMMSGYDEHLFSSVNSPDNFRFLAKPFNLPELRTVVSEMLERS